MLLFSFKRLLIAGCFLFVSSAFAGGSATTLASTGQNFIKPYRAVYDANFNVILPFQGKAVRQLKQQENGHWLLSHTIDSGVLSLQETSLFDWQAQQPKPLAYHYQQNSIGKNKNETLDFDWPAKQVHHQTDKAPGSFAIPDNTLDKLTYQLKIRQDLANSRGVGVYTVADKRKLKEYGFILLGPELLDTPVGKLETVKLKRDRGPNSDRETILWLAKEWDYLLVKIQQREDGKDYEVVMVEGDLNGQPIKGS